MSRIYCLKFLGARAYEENRTEKWPLVIAYNSKVFDCNKKAWQDGIRPGDTISQAKITSPSVQIHAIRDPGSQNLNNILKGLSTLTPFVESHSDNEVFLDLPEETAVEEKLIPVVEKHCFFVSIGVGDTKFLARAACLWAMQRYIEGKRLYNGEKEWGHVFSGKNYIEVNLEKDKGKHFLRNLPLSYLLDDSLGISSDDLSILLFSGLKTLGDIQKIPLYSLTQILGNEAHLIKSLVQGQDFSQVKTLYALQSLERTKSINIPLVSFSFAYLEGILSEMWGVLEKAGLGFTFIKICISGNFPRIEAQKNLLYTVSEFETVKNLAGFLLRQAISKFPKDKDPENYLVSSVSISFSGIKGISCKANTLFQEPMEKARQLSFNCLKTTCFDIQEKYGKKALDIGVSQDLRREEMLSFWDPVRAKATLKQDMVSNLM